MNLAVAEIKPFVPAADLQTSIRFYEALGFEVPWTSEALAQVRLGASSFLLQAFDQPAFAQNFMMHMEVASADEWHAHVVASGVVDRFGVMLGTPEDRPWGMRDFVLNDPSGVLWRIAQDLGTDGTR